MPDVTVEALVRGQTADRIFDTISDFTRYPDLVETVRTVVVHPRLPDGSVPSEWKVFFRNGILHWKEVDWFDREALTIRFEQTEGEFDVFCGGWRLAPTGDDAIRVTFQAEFDFGVASLASIIDPVAVRVLTESVQEIIRGLFGTDAVDFIADEAQRSLQPR